MTKEELQAKAKVLYEYFDSRDGGYFADHKRMFEVNVKLHDQYVNTSNVIQVYPKRYQKALTEEFTNERVENLYYSWIQWEAEELIAMVHTGGSMQAMDKAGWKKYAGDALEAGKETGYPAIDELKTMEAKRAMLDSFVAKDAEMLHAFGMIDCTKVVQDGRVTYKTNTGFYGRMGGHFCFDINYNYELLNEVVEWANYDGNEMTTADASAMIAKAEEVQKAVQYIQQYVRKAKDALSFRDELQYRMNEYVETLKDEEKAHRKELKEIALKAKSKKVASVTVVACLTHKKETIRRNARSIVKEL